MAAATSPRGHQAWISGEIWHRRMKKGTFPVDILVDTGAGGSSYMSLAFYHMIAKWGRLVTSIRKDGQGALHAVNPSSSKTSPMRILGSTLLTLRFQSETRVRRITFHVLGGLPYGLIVGVDYLKTKKTYSISDLERALNTAKRHLGYPF